MRTSLFFNFRLLAVLISTLGAGAGLADPPASAKNLWRNANDYKHYVLYERSSNTWVETVNCQVFYRFTKIGGDLNNLLLRDANRKLNVKLNYEGMYLKFDHEPAYKLYQRGTFDKRVRFFHQVNGKWTGTVSRTNACQWEELLAGGTAPSWRFVAYGEDAGSVFLFFSTAAATCAFA